jgi:beta-N-acetylhexosaminidase
MFTKHKAVIFGVSGHKLLPEEKTFFSESKPLGFFLSPKNISNKDQVASLISSLRNTINNKYAPILIDQEGGYDCSFKAPIWYTPPSASVFGKIANENLYDAKEAVRLSTILIAMDLIDLGLSSGAIPVLDVLCDDTNAVIGSRVYSSDKFIVTALGQVVCETFLEFGITPMIKHIPGHGKAKTNSHFKLPVVDADYEELLDIDFYPFRKLNDIQLAMTAHVLYKNIDPNSPATLSRKVISEIRNTIGFKNLLITDCILMKALSGSIVSRVKRALEAGCDIILHSRGTVEEMKAVEIPIPLITFDQERILRKLFIHDKKNYKLDPKKIKAKLNELLKKYQIKTIS